MVETPSPGWGGAPRDVAGAPQLSAEGETRPEAGHDGSDAAGQTGRTAAPAGVEPGHAIPPASAVSFWQDAPGEQHAAGSAAEPGPLDTPQAGAPQQDAPAQADTAAARAAAARERRRQRAEQVAFWRDEVLAWFKTVFSAAIYATLIVTFGFQVARVEGQSMAPTLADQDRLIVNKLIYHWSAPRRGDIVMLYYPVNPDKSFVKRVIAEEGDRVQIIDGRVYVNDVPLNDDYVPADFRSHDDWGPQMIPEGYYFVMGDHRNNSSDSRHWGMVPKKYIIGKVQVRWWPLPSARVF